MIVGDVVRFSVDSFPKIEVVGKVIFVAENGVMHVVSGDCRGAFQIWTFQAALLSDEEALLWKLENA
jgi:hypothetical protein